MFDKFMKWPSIGALKGVRHFALRRMPLPIHYKAKIKLHGTNAAIRINSDGIHAQKRAGGIKVGKRDNFGFAKFVQDTEPHWHGVANNTIIYGEWCGGSIQKGVALSSMSVRCFAIFAVRTEDGYIFEPEEIRKLIPSVKDKYFTDQGYDVKILPWYSEEEVVIDFYDPEGLQLSMDAINGNIEMIEKEDPWVREHYSIGGVGEGLVFYPQNTPDEYEFSDLIFKAKGVAHRVNGSKKAVELSAEDLSKVRDVALKFATDARFEQMAHTLELRFNDPAVIKRTGDFIGAVCKDIKKESLLEVEESGCEWKNVSKECAGMARVWFMRKEAE